MVPQGKETKDLMTLADFVRDVLPRVPTLDGVGVGAEKWEGHTDDQMKVEVFRRQGEPGFAVYWAYHDALGELHQCGERSVRRKHVPAIAERLAAAAGSAAPGRFVEAVEYAKAQGAAGDPTLANRTALLGLDVPGLYEDDGEGDPPADPLLLPADPVDPPPVENGLKELTPEAEETEETEDGDEFDSRVEETQSQTD